VFYAINTRMMNKVISITFFIKSTVKLFDETIELRRIAIAIELCSTTS